MSVTGLPFDDIRSLVTALPEPDERAAELVRNRQKELSFLYGAMGLESHVLEWMGRWSGRTPAVQRPMMAIFAGTHKCDKVVNGEDTLAAVTRLAGGGGAINQVCRQNDIGLKVFDLALQFPVEDIALTDAMDEKGSAATFGFGMEAIAGGIDFLGLSAFGKGDVLANGAIIGLSEGIEAESVGAFLGKNFTLPMLEVVARAIRRNKPVKDTPLELLRRLGGREHSALAGAIIAARVDHVPVVVSGETALCVVTLLEKLERGSCAHCLIAGGAGEGFSGGVASRYGLLHLLVGHEGTGEGMATGQAIGLIQSIAAIHKDVQLSV